ncbi:hypothetical protein C4571_02610 [Candidatus Parcubacteria bacterium]|nr:MAG: hypothetical protein C4571_02610 [Candidatus Parcubacteria bacterium]
MRPNTVRKIVFPVAGVGKRMRPLTLHTPKALVPLRGRPLLDYALDEAYRSGMREAILVLGPKQKNHFARYLRAAKKRYPMLAFHLRFQREPLGDGHAVLQAADRIEAEPFAVRFCDDVIVSETPVLQSLLSFHYAYHAPVILLERVPKKEVSRYGVVGIERVQRRSAELPSGGFYRLTEIVEKPSPRRAPSNFVIIGGYIFTPEIFQNLKKIADALPQPGYGELRLAVALQIEFLKKGKVYGWEFIGTRLDCGTIESLRKGEHILAKLDSQAS